MEARLRTDFSGGVGRAPPFAPQAARFHCRDSPHLLLEDAFSPGDAALLRPARHLCAKCLRDPSVFAGKRTSRKGSFLDGPVARFRNTLRGFFVYTALFFFLTSAAGRLL